MFNLRMDEFVYKCFRCNLTFKDKTLAQIHKEIMSHSTTKVRAQMAA